MKKNHILLIFAILSLLTSKALAYRDLETGVFITKDPAGFVDGPNVYTYVKQNPWSAFDPDGLNQTFKEKQTGIGWLVDGVINTVLDLLPDPKGSKKAIESSSSRAGDINAGLVDRSCAGVESLADSVLAVTDYIPLLGKGGSLLKRVITGSEKKLAEEEAAKLTEQTAKKAAEEKAQLALEEYAKGKGHHIPAASTLSGAPGYIYNKALAIPKWILEQLGVKHEMITGAQNNLYSAFAKTGKKLTWNEVESIETRALVLGSEGKINVETARTTVKAAIQSVIEDGFLEPTHIPWSK